MAAAGEFDPHRASAQHRELQRALSAELPTICFAGDPDTPDALFPNNVFATGRGADGQPRYVVGRMRHPVRCGEADRADIRGFFRALVSTFWKLTKIPWAVSGRK